MLGVALQVSVIEIFENNVFKHLHPLGQNKLHAQKWRRWMILTRARQRK